MPETTSLDTVRTAMEEEMARDNRVFLIGEDVGVYGGAFGTLDVPTPYSPPLEAYVLPNRDKVVAAARELLDY